MSNEHINLIDNAVKNHSDQRIKNVYNKLSLEWKYVGTFYEYYVYAADKFPFKALIDDNDNVHVTIIRPYEIKFFESYVRGGLYENYLDEQNMWYLFKEYQKMFDSIKDDFDGRELIFGVIEDDEEHSDTGILIRVEPNLPSFLKVDDEPNTEMLEQLRDNFNVDCLSPSLTCLDEMHFDTSDNPNYTVDDVKNELLKYGYIYDENITNDLKREFVD